MNRLSLHARLALCTAVPVTVALLAVAAGVLLAFRHAQLTALEGEMQREARHYHEQFRIHGALFGFINPHEVEESMIYAKDPRRLVQIEKSDGEVLYRSATLEGAAFAPKHDGFSDAVVNGRSHRICRMPGELITVITGSTLGDIALLDRRLIRAFLWALPGALGLAGVFGWITARNALRPVAAMADAAERIHPESLRQRVELPVAEDEIRRLAIVLNEMLQRLERGYEQATRFSADASHELKTPLTVMRASIERLLEEPGLAPRHQAEVADLLQQCSNLWAILETLLLLARADAGKLSLHVRDLDLAEVAQDCLEDAQIMAEMGGISLEVQLACVAPVKGDPTRLRQIILNLLDNAVKYNTRGGSIRVTLVCGPQQHRLSIANTGPGIAAEQGRIIFDRFHRAGQHEDVPGSGLGLSLARELARAHGGDVSYEGSEAGWTKFTLTLPCGGQSLKTEPARRTVEPKALAF